MEVLRNPFAVRNGRIILIEDLSANERGLKCQCRCPACDGEFIARMGDIKVHHFAHSKDACDEVIAYTSGLYKLIKQILEGGSPFYVPSLVVLYDIPCDIVLDESNIEHYVRIVRESKADENKIIVSSGRSIIFESTELSFDSKGHIQALELTYMNSKMAVKVMPPDTVCKTASVSAHKDMATLVLDFVDDADMIQNSNSKIFQEYMLSKRLNRFWIYNPKVKRAYPQIIKLGEKAHNEWVERQKQLVERQKQLQEERRLAEQRDREARKLAAELQAALQREQKRLFSERKMAELATNEKQKSGVSALGYEQIKDKFTQQTEQIRDSYNRRWIQCELCGEIKPEPEFSSYGGLNHVNLGHCSECTKKRSWNN